MTSDLLLSDRDARYLTGFIPDDIVNEVVYLSRLPLNQMARAEMIAIIRILEDVVRDRAFDTAFMNNIEEVMGRLEQIGYENRMNRNLATVVRRLIESFHNWAGEEFAEAEHTRLYG